MAIPPSIPTSFVPKQPVTAARKRISNVNPFLVLSYIILTVSLFAAAGMFSYAFFLDSVAKKKMNDVATAQSQIDQATVTSFIHLRDRFTAAKGIINNHVAISQFLDALGVITLQGVQFHSLNVTVAEDRNAKVTLSGSARTFNSVAAQSAVFATDKRIKRAIFSGLSSKDGSVSFDINAEIDPSLVVTQMATTQTQVAPAATPVPVATTTSAAKSATTSPGAISTTTP